MRDTWELLSFRWRELLSFRWREGLELLPPPSLLEFFFPRSSSLNPEAFGSHDRYRQLHHPQVLSSILARSQDDYTCPHHFLLDLSSVGGFWHTRATGGFRTSWQFCMWQPNISRPVHGAHALQNYLALFPSGRFLSYFAGFAASLCRWLSFLYVGHFSLLPFLDSLPLVGLCKAFQPPCSLVHSLLWDSD